MKNKRHLYSVILIAVVMGIFSVVLMGATPSDSKTVDINLAYLQTAADTQFHNQNVRHFSADPKSTDKIVGSIKFEREKGFDDENLPFKVEGQGSIHINGNVFPFKIKDRVSMTVNQNGNSFYTGSATGTLHTNKGEVPAVFTILTIPDEEKTLITVGADNISDEATALAFGKKFAEVDEYMQKKFGN
ncbi:hypothetical protein [Brevibacillus sp. H7]|uniref:hypothetical protein n=1 Tax=Brevibacillus sp. H7 TaxID=3349138 RepID=UPI00380D2488